MLSELYIENVAVIEKAEIHFVPGLNVLTGETGAGISILLDSINAVMGERMSRDLIRTGARSSFVCAAFSGLNTRVLKKLEALGYSAEEDAVLLQREVSQEGKNSCRVNGRPATLAVLRELAAGLVNIHGQHESYGLLSSEYHIHYIDRLGNTKALLQEYAAAYQEMCRLQKELGSLQTDEAQKARQVDLLNYQINELEEAGLKAGEQEELAEKKVVYSNSEKIAAALSAIRVLLDGDEDQIGALSAVQSAASEADTAGRYFSEILALSEQLHNIEYELEDCADTLRGLEGRMEYDPQELEQIEERLDQLYRLGLKYGGSEENMLAYLQQCQEELQAIEFSGERALQIKKELEQSSRVVRELADKLSAERRKVGKDFSTRVKEELRFLDMPNVTFSVEQLTTDFSPLGQDKIQFLISTNPGEPEKPLSKIASGGELSRIMLAIKTVLAGSDAIGTLIFDEIDTGISGSAAQKVGEKLKEVSSTRQVICVTHSAQIAAYADGHFFIRKQVQKGRTFTNVQPLDFNERVQELARIMGGETVSELMLKNAEQMLLQRIGY